MISEGYVGRVEVMD